MCPLGCELSEGRELYVLTAVVLLTPRTVLCPQWALGNGAELSWQRERGAADESTVCRRDRAGQQEPF